MILSGKVFSLKVSLQKTFLRDEQSFYGLCFLCWVWVPLRILILSAYEASLRSLREVPMWQRAVTRDWLQQGCFIRSLFQACTCRLPLLRALPTQMAAWLEAPAGELSTCDMNHKAGVGTPISLLQEHTTSSGDTQAIRVGCEKQAQLRLTPEHLTWSTLPSGKEPGRISEESLPTHFWSHSFPLNSSSGCVQFCAYFAYSCLRCQNFSLKGTKTSGVSVWGGRRARTASLWRSGRIR